MKTIHRTKAAIGSVAALMCAPAAVRALHTYRKRR